METRQRLEGKEENKAMEFLKPQLALAVRGQTVSVQVFRDLNVSAGRALFRFPFEQAAPPFFSFEKHKIFIGKFTIKFHLSTLLNLLL